jgi:hypothetical protein
MRARVLRRYTLLALATISLARIVMACGSSDNAAVDGGGVVTGADGGRADDGGVGEGSPGPDGAAPTDATPDGPPPPSDGGVEASCTRVPGLPPSDPGSVTCGFPATVCAVDGGGDICCTRQGTGGGVGSCVRPTSCDGVAKKECDESADCPGGGLCCFLFGGGSAGHRDIITTCMGACPYPHTNQACKTDAECGPGYTCATYVMDGYTVSTCASPDPKCPLN